MSKEANNRIKLGIFVTVATSLLIVGLYLIGSKRSAFSSTIRISAVFYNVSGLLAGNNVQYAGINIGTVDKIVIENDSSVSVYMFIEKKVKDHIKKNSIASIGTEGLMGNKQVEIIPIAEPGPSIEEGDVLHSIRSVETEEMIRTLSITNENVAAITRDLRLFTSKMSSEKGIMNIFGDSGSASNIRQAFIAFREVAENTRNATVSLNDLIGKMQKGNGLISSLANDTLSFYHLHGTIRNLEQVSDSLKVVSNQLHSFSKSLNNSGGVLYSLTRDTATTRDVKTTLSNLKTSSELLNEDLKALQKNFFFKGYFKDKEKKEKGKK